MWSGGFGTEGQKKRIVLQRQWTWFGLRPQERDPPGSGFAWGRVDFLPALKALLVKALRRATFSPSREILPEILSKSILLLVVNECWSTRNILFWTGISVQGEARVFHSNDLSQIWPFPSRTGRGRWVFRRDGVCL